MTVRGSFWLTLKRASPANKRHLTLHFIMCLHTMHKPDFYEMISSLKPLTFSGNFPRWWRIYINRLCIKCFGYRIPNKEARAKCCNIVTTLLVCSFDEMSEVRVVVGDYFNHPYIMNVLYLWGLLQDHRVMAEFVKENFNGNPKFHPQMFMFVLETILPQVFQQRVPMLVLYL